MQPSPTGTDPHETPGARIGEPVFVIGTGRCGSTALHRLLGAHRGTSWFTGLLDRLPRYPAANRLMLGAMEIPWIGVRLRDRFQPGECYEFWETLSPGFRRPARDLGSEDLTQEGEERIRTAFSAALPVGYTPIIKLTGWPRIGFLLRAFPSSRFVHIVRDGRAVAASLLKVDFWRGWQGPEGWRFGPLSPEDDETWGRSGKSPAVLAGLQWKILTGAVESTRELLPASRLIEIRYEDLCESPREPLNRVLEFCGLGWTTDLENHLRRNPLRSANPKWCNELSAEDQTRLEEAIAASLAKYGYV